jgi:hypothetical protein
VDWLWVMARKLRVQCPGALYHVMNRGDRREAMFRDDLDRREFMSTLGEACKKPAGSFMPERGLDYAHSLTCFVL